ncbi:MAG: HAD-IIB family hydrolase [Acidobacteria bacterium]|nr:HAD-IIB family hydrolase [Acidobacteriota bacterium]
MVFTDLDGTLLEHSTYSFAEAQPALDLLKSRGIPLVVCTSKTRSEVEFWRKLLGNDDPFIVENGGAVFVPVNYFAFAVPAAVTRDRYLMLQLGTPYADLAKSLCSAAEVSQCRVRGFSQMSVAEVSEHCQMSLEHATLAKAREFDEPFLILDQDRSQELLAAVERHGKRWTRGGRFHHILGENDKATAVRLLLNLYRKIEPNARSIGLGDGLNDAPFLNVVDVPILIRTAWLDQLHDLVPKGRPTDNPGPLGWGQAICELCS